MPIFVPPPSPVPAATGPDISAGEQALERIMDDGCDLTRNLSGQADALLNSATGQLVQAGPQLLYSGRCMVRGTDGSVLERGGAYPVQSNPTLYLPLSYLRLNPLAEPARGDLVIITSSRRDPAMVGRRYEIDDIAGSTFAVARRCKLIFRGF